MATFAVLSNNLVTNIIVADSKEIAEQATNSTCVEYTADNFAGIGWTYDGSVFTAPVEEPTETIEHATDWSYPAYTGYRWCNAYIDENNIVVTVTVGKDETELIDGLDTETYYAQGTPYTVKRTSYNHKIRGTHAAVGYTYNPDEDIFVMPQPYPSWTRNGSFWEAPTPMPTDGAFYQWIEADLNWQEVTNS